MMDCPYRRKTAKAKPVRLHSAAILTTVLVVAAGCDRAPARVHPPKFDVRKAAEAIVEAFDSDADGFLSKMEADQCPGIAEAWQTYDADDDRQLTVEEISQRFQEWRDDDTGMMNMRCEVQWQGKPLTEATVVLEPLPMLGPNFYAASGKTDRYGFTFVTTIEAPAHLAGVHGMQVGLYTVRINHPSVEIPPKYNSETTLGVDLSPADSNTGLKFLLSP